MITAGSMESSLPSSTKGLDSSLRIKRRRYMGGTSDALFLFRIGRGAMHVNHRAHG